jgi:single-strand DNA-binding protein
MSGFTMNSVALTGNLTRDPELRETNGGTPVANLRIAVNDRRKNGEQWEDVPMYFDVTIWGGFGKYQAENLHKGDGVAVQGRLNWREFTDKDGNNRQAVSVIADTCVPLARKNGDSSSEPSNPANAPKDAPSADEPPPPF